MNAPARSIATDAGPLAVLDLAPGTRAALEELFPTVTEIEHEGQSLLALVPIEGPRVLEGLRTGYGYGGPQTADEFARMLAIERMRIVEATASFRSRGFRGVLVPAACLAGIPDQHSQLGELLFMRVHGPLARGLDLEDTVRAYETNPFLRQGDHRLLAVRGRRGHEGHRHGALPRELGRHAVARGHCPG